MFKKFSIVAAASLFAGTVSAQSVTSGFYLEGKLQAESYWADNENVTFGLADVTLGFNGAIASSLPVGFEVDILAIESDAFATDPHLTGSVFYESSIGKLSVGLPRVALGDYVSAIGAGGTRLVGFDPETLFKSTAKSALLSGEVSFDYGVRFDSTVNGVDFGLSYHQLFDADTVMTGAMRFGFSEVYVASAGFEYFDEPGVDAGVYGTLEADYGIYGGLLGIASPTGTTEIIYTAEAFYEPSENIDFVTGYTSVGGENLFSFDAEYTFLKNAYVGASVLGDFSGDPKYTVYAGWNVNFGG